jgi:RimJ/RimL family protein N-acetyltransferase
MIEFFKLTIEDLSFLNEVRNECCEEYLHDSRKFTLEQTIDWFNKTKPMFWIIRVDGERVGYFRTSNYLIENRNIYIGADLHKNFRGKGLAFESYKLFIPYLFGKYNLHKISLEVLSTNQRAINLYKKLGFKFEGIKREEIYKNGQWIDSIIMSILESEVQHESLKAK